MFLKRRFYYRPLAFILSVFFLMFAPLGSYVDARIGKFQSHAFAIALPAGIAAYEVVKYALITIATTAGVYGITTADWDRIIFEFKYSELGNLDTLDAWSDNLVSREEFYYDDGTLRNILIDYAMVDTVDLWSYAVGTACPDYDLSDLPSLDLDDRETIDNTAKIMDKYYDYIINLSDPIKSDEQLRMELEQMLQDMINQLKDAFDQAGGHVPDVPEPHSAQNELNQAICDYFNYIVHSFEANSTFYNPQNGNGYNFYLCDTLLNAWLAFLVSSGLANEHTDSSSSTGVSVDYGLAQLDDIISSGCVKVVTAENGYSLYQGLDKSFFRDGIPSGLVDFLNIKGTWIADVRRGSTPNIIWFYSLRSLDTVLFNTKTGKLYPYDFSNGFYISDAIACYNPDYDNDYFTENANTYFKDYESVLATTTLGDVLVSPSLKVLVTDGVTIVTPELYTKEISQAYLNPGFGVDTLPVDLSGGISIYYPGELIEAISGFFTQVDLVAQAPSTDLAQQSVQNLFDHVDHIYTPPADPDVPVEPDFPLVPDVPVTPVDPGGSDTSGDPNLDGMQIPQSITDKFPFCVPFDLIDCVKVWNVPSKAPVWEFPFVVESLGINEKITIDLTMFDSVTAVLRFLILLSYIVFLIVLTRQIIKG